MDLSTGFKIFISCICVGLTALLLPDYKASAQTEQQLFYTSFENGNPVLAWKNMPENEKNGKQLTHGVKAPGGNGKTMATYTSRGPSDLYNAPKRLGWTGRNVLTYAGKTANTRNSYAYNKLYRVHIPVAKDTQLSYLVAPEATKKDPTAQTAGYVSIDLKFSDGSYLHQLNAVDQNGVRITPEAQGKSGTLLMNQWNQKSILLGKAAKGKTIVRILLAFKASQANSTFQGAIDDLLISNSSAISAAKVQPVDQVNILRGTASGAQFVRGDTVPAIGVPNGFNYWSPALNSSAKKQIYPYSKNNDPDNLPELQSFSLSQSANDQNGIRQTLQVMPSSFSGTPSASRLGRGKAFKRSDESASPYRYAVTFTDGMRAELAATSRAAIMRYTFTGKQGSLIFDNLDRYGNLTLHPKTQSLEGYSDIKNKKTGSMNRMFFYATVDRPVVNAQHLSGEDRDRVTAYFRFDTSKKRTVTLKVGSSLISTEQAKKNLNQEISKKASIKDIADKAKKEWNERLSRITVEGAVNDQQSTLYSNLYRLYQSPNEKSENVGTKKKPKYRYADLSVPASAANTANHTGAPIKKGRIYGNSAFAYSTQTVWPAYALLEPKLTGRFINGFLTVYKNGGRFDTDAGTAFADAIAKGVPGVNTSLLYTAMLHAASVPQDEQEQLLIGYTPSVQKNSVGQTLNRSINNFALGNLGRTLAEKKADSSSLSDDSRYYLSQSQNYLQLFNRSANSFTPRKANGKWDTGASGSSKLRNKTAEDLANAFNVSQDGQGLINLYGGKAELIEGLDRYLSTEPAAQSIKKQAEARLALSGHLGLFTLDKNSSPSLPYMYLFASAPWKTQNMTRTLLNRFYTGGAIGQGYLGSDAGAMLSGYYFFGAAGIYPLQKGSANYVIGAPYFKKMTLHLESGKDLIISAPNVSNKNQYVQSVSLNGKPLQKTTLSANDLANGGTLNFDMGSEPSSWGTSTDAAPESLTAQSTNGSSLFPKPLIDLTDKASINRQSEEGSLTSLVDSNLQTSVKFNKEHPSVIFHFKTENRRIKMYTLTSSNGRDSSDPENWTMWGSNDGTTWDLLDTRTNQKFKWRSMTRAFSIKNPKAYSYYRINVTKNSNSHPLSISELQLLGYSEIPDGFETMRRDIIHQFELKNLTESETASLSNALNEAQMAYMDGNLSSSVYYMQTYVRLINSFIYKVTAPEKVRSSLSADAHAMVNLLSD
ncbi:GH92 family glycosyl hydrolase [Sporolactobacillus shoreicorticis]|uniref:GH92 family glycosyl hydrolase n=1 Tax=Sporolactobacillus shoreicorticis TaxID=1923877 RepID=A0ABW5S2Y4_9BACL|nr:GH92 family glycosyl hydrolase [Sporolactobacillus shoreicorticis]MCO7125833.1 GH92 family glycosyl hydrolase [Sporolactobacillus shoreicorticis]